MSWVNLKNALAALQKPQDASYGCVNWGMEKNRDSAVSIDMKELLLITPLNDHDFWSQIDTIAVTQQ